MTFEDAYIAAIDKNGTVFVNLNMADPSFAPTIVVEYCDESNYLGVYHHEDDIWGIFIEQQYSHIANVDHADYANCNKAVDRFSDKLYLGQCAFETLRRSMTKDILLEIDTTIINNLRAASGLPPIQPKITKPVAPITPPRIRFAMETEQDIKAKMGIGNHPREVIKSHYFASK